jgi:hypothetical protein
MSTTQFRLQCPKCSSTNIEVFKEGIGWGKSGDLVLHCHVCGKYVYGKKNVEAIQKEQVAAWEATHDDRESERRQAEVEAAEQQRREELSLQVFLQQIRQQGQQLLIRFDVVADQLTEYTRRVEALAPVDEEAGNLATLVRLDIMRSLERAAEGRQQVGRLQGATNPPAARKCLRMAQEALDDVCSGLVEVSRRFNRLLVRIQEAPPAPEPAPAPAPEPTGPICAWQKCDKPTAPNSKYCSSGCRNRNARWRHRQRAQQRRDSNVVEMPKPPKPKPQRATVSCAWCSAPLERMPYQIRRNKSGLFFCNQEHNKLWVANQGNVIDMNVGT